MKRWFRPVAYSLILVLVALASLAGPAPPTEAEDFVRALPREEGAAEARRETPAKVPPAALLPRGDGGFATDLFTAPALPPPAPVEAAAPVEAPIPELKLLGWIEVDGVPQVFVELGEEASALTPGQLAGDVFRFDSLGAGTARFTYLPTGASREFAVSDPAVAAD